MIDPRYDYRMASAYYRGRILREGRPALEAGCTRLRFDGVNGHLFMVAAI